MSSSIFITGCSRGLGLEMVRQLTLSSDWIGKIYASARKPSDDLKALLDNPKVKFIQLDVLDESSIKAAAAEVTKDLQGKGLNYLINNAAVLYRDDLESITPEVMNTTLQTNITAPTIMIKEFLPLMKKSASDQEPSLIVNISSAVGSFGITDSGFNFSYRISKAGLNMLTHTLRFYLTETGVKIMSVHPGWVLTDMGGPNAQQTPEGSIKQVIDLIRKPDPSFYGQMVNYAGKILPW